MNTNTNTNNNDNMNNKLNKELNESNKEIKNDLFNNIERSIYTFNIGNINEICFNKVFNKDSNKVPTELDYIKMDNCIDKYFETFEIVKNEIYEKL